MTTLALPILRQSEHEGDRKSPMTLENPFSFSKISIQPPYSLILSCRYYILTEEVLRTVMPSPHKNAPLCF